MVFEPPRWRRDLIAPCGGGRMPIWKRTCEFGCMCAETRFGRACSRLRMSLYGFGLHHGLRGGCAAPEPEAVVGATHLFRCLAWHRGGLGCACHPNALGGRSEPAIPCGKANRQTGTSMPGSPALARGAPAVGVLGCSGRSWGSTVPRPCGIGSNWGRVYYRERQRNHRASIRAEDTRQ